MNSVASLLGLPPAFKPIASPSRSVTVVPTALPVAILDPNDDFEGELGDLVELFLEEIDDVCLLIFFARVHFILFKKKTCYCFFFVLFFLSSILLLIESHFCYLTYCHNGSFASVHTDKGDADVFRVLVGCLFFCHNELVSFLKERSSLQVSDFDDDFSILCIYSNFTLCYKLNEL